MGLGPDSMCSRAALNQAMSDLPSQPNSDLPDYRVLGPDPEPPGLRAEELIAQVALRT